MENYYKILRVPRQASSTEILAAYHAAKGAIHQEAQSRGEAAKEDLESFGQQIEVAYQTLSDPQKRTEYDELLTLMDRSTAPQESSSPQEMDGPTLRQHREVSNLSREEVFRITRIPVKFLRAIEEDIVKEMPARVYLQGFIKNLAHVYKLPPQKTVESFLKNFDQRYPDRGKN